MQKYSFAEHFLELKNRVLKVVLFFTMFFGVSYCFKENIFEFFLGPLASLSGGVSRKIIYTGLAEAFFSYVKLSSFVAFAVTVPFACYQFYAFIAPGLHRFEKNIIAMMLTFSPLLFFCGLVFVFYFVMPKAWEFFLSYENNKISLPLVMEARISEYLSLVMQLTIAFGVAFQLPIFIVIFCILGVVGSSTLRQKRRFSIVIIFIIAAMLTPPDVISQIALAIPLLMLYEVSIMLCVLVENRENKNVRR